MNKLTADDLIKLAKSSPKARDFVLHLAKVASGDSSSEFNESVPAMNTEQLEADKASLPSQTPGKPNQPPVAEPAVPPMEQAPVEAAPAPEGPEAIGARAAQSFIGPEIMQAAVSGDPAAQDLISRTAGQVAGAVTEMLTRAGASQGNMAPAEGPVPAEGGIPAEGGGTPMAGGMAPAIATPEEDLANEIIPPVAPVASVAPVAPGMPAGQAPASPASPVPPAVPAGPAVPPGQAPQQGDDQGVIGQGKGPETVVNPEPGAAPAAPAPAAPAEGGEAVSVEDVKKLIELAKAGKI